MPITIGGFIMREGIKTTVMNVDIKTRDQIKEHVKKMEPKYATMKHFVEISLRDAMKRDEENLKQLGQQ